MRLPFLLFNGDYYSTAILNTNRMGEPNSHLDSAELWSAQTRLKRYAPLLVWMGVIFFASTGEFSASNTALLIQPFIRWFFPHISVEHLNLIHFLVRKLGHFTEYAVLALLAARAFANASHAGLRRHWVLLTVLLVCVYALFDEYHQSFVPSRTASIYDSMIDSAGGLTALVLMGLWRKWRRGRAAINADATAEE
jgi:VanZ family protein